MNKREFKSRSMELAKQYLSTHIELTDDPFVERKTLREKGGEWVLLKRVLYCPNHPALVEFQVSHQTIGKQDKQTAFYYPVEDWKTDFSNC